MKFTTILLTSVGLVAAVAALPLYEIDARAVASGQDLEKRFAFDADSIHSRDFQFGDINERDNDIERRQNPKEVETAVEVVKDIIDIVNLIKGKIARDKKMRGEYTSHMIDVLRQKHPHFNFVICHTNHRTDFTGVQGKDWGHRHHELGVSFGKTIGYEFYWFKQGAFHRIGDGGYLNWAYGGNVKSTSNGGKDVVFGPI